MINLKSYEWKGKKKIYYENKKEKREKLILYIFCIVIIALLAVLILRTENIKNLEISSNYETSKLSLNQVDAEETNVSDEEIIENTVKSIVGISKLRQSGSSIFLSDSEETLGIGSGTIVTENGYILTNQHVAGNKYSNCYVTLEDGRNFNGTVVWADSNIDLAIVKIDSENLSYISLADSDNIYLAQEVYAIGNPIGIEFQRTVTKGIISGKNRTIKIGTDDEAVYMEDLIQTDATINEGNSGGALINTSGELIGINTVKISDAEGIGFAVPINIVKPIIEKLVENGKFEEAYLGIYGYDKEVIPYLDSSLEIDSGIYIAKILTDGPLYSSGVYEKDIITKIDGVSINKMNELKKYIYSKSPGDTVTLTIQRKLLEFEVEIKLGYKFS